MDVRTHRGHNLVILLVLVPLIGSVLAILGALVFDQADALWGLLGFLSVVTYAPIVFGISKGKLDLFEIVIPVSVVYFLGYVIRTIYILNPPEEFSNYILGYATLAAIKYLPIALVYTIVGFSLFIVGYYSSFGRIVARKMPVWLVSNSSQNVSQIRLLAVFIAGAVFTVLRLATEGIAQFNGLDPLVSPFTHIISIASNLAQFALLYYFLNWLKAYPGFHRFPMFLMFCFVAGGSLLTQLRGPIVLLVISLIICYYYTRKPNILRLVLGGAIVLLIALFIFFPITTEFRRLEQSELVGSGVNIEFLTKRLGSFAESFSNVVRGAASTNAGDVISQVAFRLRGIDSLMLMIQKTPYVMDYQYGKTYLSYFQDFVPRFLWSDKPASSLGRMFNLLYIGVSDQSPGSAAITPLGELYLNFGEWGVLGMFFVGIFYRITYEYMIERLGSFLPMILVYSFTVVAFASNESNLGALFSGWTMNLVLLVLMLRFVTVRDYASKTILPGITKFA